MAGKRKFIFEVYDTFPPVGFDFIEWVRLLREYEARVAAPTEEGNSK
jgi:hypothetical protein